jgi:hypothetical protein
MAADGPDHVPCGCRACRHERYWRRLYPVLLAWIVLVLAWFSATGILDWRLR